MWSGVDDELASFHRELLTSTGLLGHPGVLRKGATASSGTGCRGVVPRERSDRFTDGLLRARPG